jgi:hypothetical protein
MAPYTEVTIAGVTVKIDRKDLALLREPGWCVGQTYKGYLYVMRKRNRKTQYFHRLLVNAPERMEVDHINHDTLDNRRSNLRIVTTRQNQLNSAKAQRPGVALHKGSWRARIRMPDGKRPEKYFPTQEAAETWWYARHAERMAFEA